jgi:hypothetical protein
MLHIVRFCRNRMVCIWVGWRDDIILGLSQMREVINTVLPFIPTFFVTSCRVVPTQRYTHGLQKGASLPQFESISSRDIATTALCEDQSRGMHHGKRLHSYCHHERKLSRASRQRFNLSAEPYTAPHRYDHKTLVHSSIAQLVKPISFSHPSHPPITQPS